ncbi:hypothetical protein JM93_02167 [Roseibium hamelinense]|uniref:N-acetyltransferase domain-containing protein n=1 Tax=Roseibium hamelinense TaxID=150831 RepID=A0A562T3S6_9HYPH|nr:hypothetical protein [Roseibium hamelinense]MTI42963.1 hypothetical protein [Roseibium hamelinense]TWI87600.1 hypothetical protein JM93_02167 [Roseibium hamelinense]
MRVELALAGPALHRKAEEMAELAFSYHRRPFPKRHRIAFRYLLVEPLKGRVYLVMQDLYALGLLSLSFVHSIQHGGLVAELEIFHLCGPHSDNKPLRDRVLELLFDDLQTLGAVGVVVRSHGLVPNEDYFHDRGFEAVGLVEYVREVNQPDPPLEEKGGRVGLKRLFG